MAVSGIRSETPFLSWGPGRLRTATTRQGDFSEIQVEMDDAENLRWSTLARRPRMIWN